MKATEPDSNQAVFTVLVVDDSLPERNLVKTLFQQRGHRVIEAADGAEALLMLASELPDAVVVDGVMPILDGYQLCRLLKDDPATQHLPVILLTGQAEGLSRFWARICGADRFLLKGRDSTRVVDKTLELLAHSPGVSSQVDRTVECYLRDLGSEVIHQRLSKALEHRLLEAAMRDTVGHLYSLQRDANDMAAGVLELLHELVLPGAIHLVIRSTDGPVGFGLHGSSVGPEARAFIEEAARRSLGREAPWSSTWAQRPPLKERCTELQDPILFSLPVGLPAGHISAWMTLYLERHAFQIYERLFQVACLELGRLLALVQDRRKLAQMEEALAKAQKMESLALMASGVAHDFNNLFQSIMGSLQVAEMSPTDERGKLALARALTAVQKGAAMGRRMLETSGQMWCVTAPMNLNALVLEVVGAHPNLPFTLQLAEALPLIDGDRNHLKQALSHLVENAVEAIGSGPGNITITTRLCEDGYPEDSAGRWFTISIADNGCGANEEVLDRMFDPFFSTKLFGRGMGLAATLGILKAHHAALHVESRVGEGTRFQVWLALAE